MPRGIRRTLPMSTERVREASYAGTADRRNVANHLRRGAAAGGPRRSGRCGGGSWRVSVGRRVRWGGWDMGPRQFSMPIWLSGKLSGFVRKCPEVFGSVRSDLSRIGKCPKMSDFQALIGHLSNYCLGHSRACRTERVGLDRRANRWVQFEVMRVGDGR